MAARTIPAIGARLLTVESVVQHAMTRQTCPRCGMGLFRVHCKLVCEQCGVVRDCSDPF